MRTLCIVGVLVLVSCSGSPPVAPSTPSWRATDGGVNIYSDAPNHTFVSFGSSHVRITDWNNGTDGVFEIFDLPQTTPRLFSYKDSKGREIWGVDHNGKCVGPVPNKYKGFCKEQSR